MRILLSVFLLLTFVLTNAQVNQAEYLEGKRQFSLGNYRDAMGSFQGLTEDPVFGAYASFYYALSAYNQEVPQVALDMWKQILIKHPKWDQNDEVNFWLAKASFERKKYLDAIKFSQKLSESEKNSLTLSVQEELDPMLIGQLLEENADNEDLARLYFRSLANQSQEDRDHEKLQLLTEKFDFELAEVIGDFPKVMKDSYAVAVTLPFMFDSLKYVQPVIKNLIFELYQGMLVAQDSLKQEGISVELFPFDTKKTDAVSREIISNESLANADVIIGPLYAEPINVIYPFADQQEIPVINPLSSNASLIRNNKDGFLFKPGYSTQGREAGIYATKKFTRNKNAIIFYETQRDQIVAESYKEVLEKDSFNIVLFDELNKDNALQFQADWTHQYESSLDTLSQEEIDSITLIPNRYVRTRAKKDDKTGRVLKDEDGEDRLEYYEMRYTIPQDTIGHIFAATSSNLLSNNIISLTEVRGDSIGVIGYEDWLKFRLVSFNQLERLNVSFIHTSYFPDEKMGVVADKIRSRFWTEPTQYHCQGYELIMQLGRLFSQNGKHFQRGLMTGKHIEGHLMEGLKYGGYRDNQVVPIVTIEELQILRQNKVENED